MEQQSQNGTGHVRPESNRIILLHETTTLFLPCTISGIETKYRFATTSISVYYLSNKPT